MVRLSEGIYPAAPKVRENPFGLRKRPFGLRKKLFGLRKSRFGLRGAGS
jgi:hypothetical protein